MTNSLFQLVIQNNSSHLEITWRLSKRQKLAENAKMYLPTSSITKTTKIHQKGISWENQNVELAQPVRRPTKSELVTIKIEL